MTNSSSSFRHQLKIIGLYINAYLMGGWRSAYPHIHDLFSVFRCLWFHFIMVGVGLYALTSTEQAQDMLYVLADTIQGGPKLWWMNKAILFYFFVFIFWWSFVMWFTARYILTRADIRLLRHTLQLEGVVRVRKISWYIRFIIRFFPRICGTLPFVFVLIGVLSLGWEYRWGGLLFGILSLMAFLFYTFRAELMNWLIQRNWLQRIVGMDRLQLLKVDPRRFDPRAKAMSRSARIVSFIALFIALGLFVTLSLVKTAALPQLIGPHGLILSALGGWTVFGSILVLNSYRYRIPGFIILIIYTVFVSRYNDNHAVRMTTRLSHVDERQTITERFDSWLRSYIADSTVFVSDTTEIPVIIVAAQGGGIRAMNWTARVLEQLSSDQQLPDFYRHVFAMSGVSGGSVGIAFEAGYHTEQKTDTAGFNKMLSTDYLSPVTAGLLYPDLVQKVLWWPRESFDRAKRLEDAWSMEYRNAFTENTFDADFLSLWNGKKRPVNQVPSLFLNSVVAESGQKAIISNIQLDELYFPDAIDVIHETGYDMPLKSAALCSARFPFVTPGGLVYLTGNDAGHLIDGGYLENTGTVTAMSILCAINDYIAAVDDPADSVLTRVKRKIRPVLLFIQNADFGASAIQPLRRMHELGVPPSGFIKAWDRGGVALDKQMALLSARLTLPVSYVKFELKRDSVKIPLSWYISQKADKEVTRQAHQLRSNTTTNKNSYEILLGLFGDRIRKLKALPERISD